MLLLKTKLNFEINLATININIVAKFLYIYLLIINAN